MARLDSLEVEPEDVFCESARLLDFLLSTPDISQHQVDSLWNLMLLDIRKWKSDATDHDKRMVANTVFLLVRALLTQYYDTHYSEDICDMLDSTITREMKGCDEKEQEGFNQRLIDQSPAICNWINTYDEENYWLSDRISRVLSPQSQEADDILEEELPLNLDSPRINLQQLLKQPWFSEVRTDERYDAEWTDALVEALMASEHGEHIARDWAVQGQRERKNQIRGHLVGLLKDNDVIEGDTRNSYPEMAAKVGIVVNKSNKKNPYGSFANYMTRGKNQPYADWVKEYVKQHGFQQ